MRCHAGENGSGAPAPVESATPKEAAQEEDDAEWELEIEELMKLIALLPPSVRGALEEHPQQLELLEVVMDLGRPPLARFPTGDFRLAEEPVTSEDLEFAIEQVGALPILDLHQGLCGPA